MIHELSVKDQSVETSGITKDYKKAICEYIWNGLEANADCVTVDFVFNKLNGLSEIVIKDNGDGIKYDNLDDTFGTFLASQKNGLSINSKSKGNKGKGRFSGFGFGSSIEWKTIVNSKDGLIEYSILLKSDNKNKYETSEPIKAYASTGTTVTITVFDELCDKDVDFYELEDFFLQEFAWFLYLNKSKNVTIMVSGQKIDYEKYIDIDNSQTNITTINSYMFEITLVVWIEKIKENFCSYYLDDCLSLCGKDTTSFNRNCVNFNHSVYVKSSFFKGKNNISLNKPSSEFEEQLAFENYEADKKTCKQLKKAIQEMISQSMEAFLSRHADKAVMDMINRDSFPHFSDDIYGTLRKKDLVKVTTELYRLEAGIFYNLKPIQEKSILSFLNLLLSSEERENVISIIDEIIELSPQQRQHFSDILKRTRLANIIDSIKFIEERYKVIETLKTIIYNLPDYANERDHLQKIIEQHYWLFGEQYHLVTSDKPMKKALEKYLNILYGESVPTVQLSPDIEEMRRMDIFACASRKIENAFGSGTQENLIVELKAPKIVLTKKILRQIEDYMDFIMKQPQFNSIYREWKFIAVCKDVDKDIKNRYKPLELYNKRGLVTKVENFEIYALTWDDVFSGFELRHSFLLDKLKIDREAIAAELQSEMEADVSRKTIDELAKKISI